MFLKKFLTAGHGVFSKTYSAAAHVDTKASANQHFCRCIFTVNFKRYAFKTRLGKITYFSTVVSFAAMVNKLNEKIRHQISNLVLFHKEAIFQVVLTSTSRRTHAQECAKIILNNMGNNEEKTDISLK